MKTRPGLLGALLGGFCAVLAGSSPPSAAPPARPDMHRGVVVNKTLHSPALVANLLGDSPDRPVAIYLPPGYASSTSRYPVVYLLHGFNATNKAWTERDWANVPRTMDRLIAAGKIRKMIVVMPDGSTKLGGSLYTNSVACGNWEDYADLLVEGSGDTRKVLEMRQALWSANMPVAMLSQYRSNLARLRAIAFDVGSQDENHDIRAGARDFDAGLNPQRHSSPVRRVRGYSHEQNR